MISDVCRLPDEVVRYFSSKGPRTDVQVALMDYHIATERDRSKDSWTQAERAIRAKRAGSYHLVPQAVELTPINDEVFYQRKVKAIND